MMLSMTNSKDNPTAVCMPISSSKTFGKGVMRHFGKKDKTGKASLLCKRCKVSINGKNFYPLWGLHNGACGEVEEIIFAEEASPNRGDLPLYVVVNFPLYRGPAWDLNSPKSVPIPTSSIRCNKGCCERAFVPLEVSFARTIHTFQGLQAGPTEKGKPKKHMYEHIVCDPDKSKYEATNTGLLYTAVSRGTTLGDKDGLNSAIYFTGDRLTTERIKHTTRCQKVNDTYMKVKKRNLWVNHLKKNTDEIKKIGKKERKVLQYFSTKTFSKEAVKKRCMEYTKQ